MPITKGDVMPLLQTARATLYYTDHRKADSPYTPVIYIHGAGGTHLDWAGELRRLPQANAIALDLPAHGKSSPPHRTSVIDYADDVVSLADSLGISQAIFAGHSMGGAIAQQIALSHPHKVAGLILMGTGAKLRVHPDILERVLTDYAGVAQLLKNWLWGENTPETMRQISYEQLQKIPASVTHGDYMACNQFDIRDQLGNITAPTLVISATHDQMTPLKYGEYLAEHLPNAQLVVIQNAGHMLMLEYPQQVADHIAQWIDNQQRA